MNRWEFIYGHSVEYKLWPVLIWEPNMFGWLLELHFLGWHGGITYYRRGNK